MSEGLWFVIAAVALTPLAGVFAAVDAAIGTASPARVSDMVKEGRAGAARLEAVIDDRATYIGLAVFLRVVCEVAATVFAAVAASDYLGVGWGICTAIIVMTVVSYVAVGVGPRTLGRQNAYSIGCVAAVLLQLVGIALRPLTRILIVLGNALTPGRGYRNGPFATEVELREAVDIAEARGVVAADERRMIHSVFELGDTNAREVMVPRPEMVWIEATKSAAQAANLAIRSGHSRVPVIGENPDDILGVIYLKDIVQRAMSGTAATVTVAELMRPAEFIPDSKPLDKVLADMQRTRHHMAMLVDEYGGIAGLVTIEDVLEEIVGEITDEYDSDETAPVEDLGDGRYRVSARLSVDDLSELFEDVEINDEDVETVGGLVALELGRVPLPGATVVYDDLLLIAEGGPNRQGRQRITTVIVSHAPGSARREPTEPSDRVPHDDAVKHSRGVTSNTDGADAAKEVS